MDEQIRLLRALLEGQEKTHAELSGFKEEVRQELSEIKQLLEHQNRYLNFVDSDLEKLTKKVAIQERRIDKLESKMH